MGRTNLLYGYEEVRAEKARTTSVVVGTAPDVRTGAMWQKSTSISRRKTNGRCTKQDLHHVRQTGGRRIRVGSVSTVTAGLAGKTASGIDGNNISRRRNRSRFSV
ncbi:hypothetical protein L798_05183 [Zootermopsis nevadensis]|uniref:Uncharacterized protein n=1 Tax=Zootermopsis nevadensis TaxID=136037 RepID=A0A067RL78_ZOONE|nr:hypothetical protein L798_05183 [Zootermopsis nevadensis]